MLGEFFLLCCFPPLTPLPGFCSGIPLHTNHLPRYRFMLRVPEYLVLTTPYLFSNLKIAWFVGNSLLISVLSHRVGLKVTTARETLKKCGIIAVTA